ncbi:MAG: biotin/lipoyl-binding protein, partial [Panacibacter sp.]
MKQIWAIFSVAMLITSCSSEENSHDASGSFESDEVIVSSEQNGQLLSFSINEGDSLTKGQLVGFIDSTNLVLQKQQVQASLQSLSAKTMNVNPQLALLNDQLAVQQSQLDHLMHERDRLEKLVKAEAATQKQLEDMIAQVEQLQKQMQVTRQQIKVQLSNTGAQNRSIMSESDPLQKQVDLINRQISKANIVNPITGTVLSKYAQEGEITAAGKAL